MRLSVFPVISRGSLQLSSSSDLGTGGGRGVARIIFLSRPRKIWISIFFSFFLLIYLICQRCFRFWVGLRTNKVGLCLPRSTCGYASGGRESCMSYISHTVKTVEQIVTLMIITKLCCEWNFKQKML